MDARLLPLPAWSDLPLVRALEEPYHSTLLRVFDVAAPLLAGRPLGAEGFTDHDLRHSTRVVQRAHQILPDVDCLNQPELFVFLLAALLHDAGMWTSREEALRLIEDETFTAYCEKYVPGEFRLVVSDLRSSERHWMGELGLTRLAAAFHRLSHPDRLASSFLQPSSEAGQQLRPLIGAEFVELVEVVSMAHGWDTERMLQDDLLRPRAVGGLVNVRYVAQLLRLGDLLDVGEGRVSSLVWSFLRPLGSTSEAHWRKESRLRLERCEPDRIDLAGTFDIRKEGIVEAEGYRLALDWIAWLKKEVEAALVLAVRQPPDFRQRCRFGALNVDASRVKAFGLELGGKVVFEMDRTQILSILSSAIYESGPIFVRELLQNAVDATRAQMVRDMAGSPLGLDAAAPWSWPPEVTQQDRYAIHVDTRLENRSGREFVVFTVRDSGIGMTPQQVQDYFLQVGRSFHKSSAYRKEFKHPSISRFGIGFLSCLAVADRIEVYSRPRAAAAGLRLTYQMPSEHFTVERDDAPSEGTTVALWIDTNRPADDRRALAQFNYMWLPNTYGLDADRCRTYWSMSPTWSADDDGETAGEQSDAPWSASQLAEGLGLVTLGAALDVEMPLVINEERFVRPGDLTARGRNIFGPDCRVLSLRLTSPSGREIAGGLVGLHHLERGSLGSDVIRLLLGFGVDSFSSGFGDLGEGRIKTMIDFRRLPPGALGAGRTFRHSVSLDGVMELIEAALRRHVFERLREQSEERAAAWRLATGQDDALPLLLPLRDRNSVEWVTFEQAAAAHERIVLVPLVVAWKGPWSSDVPCLGITGTSTFATSSKERRLSDCVLLDQTDVCTAVLWPPAARNDDLNLFTGRGTCLPDGFAIFDRQDSPLRWKDIVRYAEAGADVEGVSTAAYDRGVNPWEYLGFNDGTLEKQERHGKAVAAITNALKKARPIDYPADLLHLVLPDGDTWE